MQRRISSYTLSINRQTETQKSSIAFCTFKVDDFYGPEICSLN